MPIYVYKNLRTGDTFELTQRITEPALTEHPETGDPVKRVVQPVGIAFKGSGFYVTDNRRGGNGAAASKTAPAAGAKAGGDAGPADAASKAGTEGSPGGAGSPSSKSPSAGASTD